MNAPRLPQHLVRVHRGPFGANHVCAVCGFAVFASARERYASTRAAGALRSHVAAEHRDAYGDQASARLEKQPPRVAAQPKGVTHA